MMLTYICDFFYFIYPNIFTALYKNKTQPLHFLQLICWSVFCNLVDETVRVWGRKTGFRKKIMRQSWNELLSTRRKGFFLFLSTTAHQLSWDSHPTNSHLRCLVRHRAAEGPLTSLEGCSSKIYSLALWSNCGNCGFQMLRMKNTTQILQEAFFFFSWERKLF